MLKASQCCSRFISQFYEAFTPVYFLFCNYRSIFASTFDYQKSKYEGQRSKTKHKQTEENVDEYLRTKTLVTFFPLDRLQTKEKLKFYLWINEEQKQIKLVR